MKKIVFLFLLFFLISLTARAQQLKLEGQVLEADTNRGIPALSVKLIAAPDLSQPDRITSTNRDGQFYFGDLYRGRYLLEVRQGVTLLHRETITMEGDAKKQITLKRK
ncbi:MAG TPA: carboxypeptidase-like regulatory domain-containing protein [Blastocatellia bacterium]|nr:carboxypeptidase-like regulatory domain-containing protein [Blastocatellia bacterium]HMX29561.1 carboxypeptidase-like regulatory domain-containing protein [Blastocatellia bacterium]HMY72045.1 carboxypeptidase-like regulatory domain-containing protein [Blastocatellia bacterium]HMZ20793.1 carboxypeptidase-like regulatory domain-containing protein [Blastocatellia bacterium]HNG30044.1 carboxypeptidase-like regulatory domain-containing protein [Blastocatellia bacterium]